MKQKTIKKYWQEKYFKEVSPTIAHENDIIRIWIEKYIPKVIESGKKSCIEIGAYPGKYLAIFGKLGYVINGIDFCEQIDTLKSYFDKLNIQTGMFWKEDFLKLNLQNKFDIVASFGFVEHFINFEEIIEKHIELLNDGGYLIIEVPNFSGFFQYWFHFYFDKENLKRHNVKAMNLNKWKDILAKHNFNIIFIDYLGTISLWVEKDNQSKIHMLCIKLINKLTPILLKLFPVKHRIYSPYLGIVAQKVCNE